MKPALVIRADAGSQLGTGHLMRCLALAQEWCNGGGQVEFVSVCDSDPMRQWIAAGGFPLTPVRSPYPHPSDWESLSLVLAAQREAWVVLDGYHFDASYQSRIKQAGYRLLVIDDMAHLDTYHADVLLNQNLHAAELYYHCKPDTQLLLGNRYALLRTEFLRWLDWERKIPPVAHRILITMGGSDPHNQSMKVIQALRQLQLDSLDAVVVIGPSNPRAASLESLVKECDFPIRLARDVTDMAELMAWADLSISTASSTGWELAFMGLPSILLVTAENQQKVGAGLAHGGIAINLGWFADVSENAIAKSLQTLVFDSDGRKRMSVLGRQAVNGNGAKNVISAMDQHIQLETDPLHFRYAAPEDAKLLWQWANDPTVRANSFNSDPISLDEHLEWYRGKLNSPDTRFLILELGQSPVAQIRYDRIDSQTAEIAFSVAPQSRGQGIGTRALMLTKGPACKELGVQRFLGSVLSSNRSSIRAFTKAGFRCTEQKLIHQKLSSIFVMENPQTLD